MSSPLQQLDLFALIPCFFFLSRYLVSLSNFVLAMGNVIKPRVQNISTIELMNRLFVFLLIVWELYDRLRCRKWTMICRKFHRTSFGKHREMSGQSICFVPFVRFGTHGYQRHYTSFTVGHKRKKIRNRNKTKRFSTCSPNNDNKRKFHLIELKIDCACADAFIHSTSHDMVWYVPIWSGWFISFRSDTWYHCSTQVPVMPLNSHRILDAETFTNFNKCNGIYAQSVEWTYYAILMAHSTRL